MELLQGVPLALPGAAPGVAMRVVGVGGLVGVVQVVWCGDGGAGGVVAEVPIGRCVVAAVSVRSLLPVSILLPLGYVRLFVQFDAVPTS